MRKRVIVVQAPTFFEMNAQTTTGQPTELALAGEDSLLVQLGKFIPDMRPGKKRARVAGRIISGAGQEGGQFRGFITTVGSGKLGIHEVKANG